MKLLEPDKVFARISKINIKSDLIDAGFKFVILDIDNTILTRDGSYVPRDIGFWLAQARDAGLTFCLLSNNWHSNVLELADELQLPIVAKACKPQPFSFVLALAKIDARANQTVVIGDQLLTDILGAHLAGMKGYLVAPLSEVDLKHTLFLRKLERLMSKRDAPNCSYARSRACACKRDVPGMSNWDAPNCISQ